MKDFLIYSGGFLGDLWRGCILIAPIFAIDAWLKQDRINKRLAKIENLVMEEDAWLKQDRINKRLAKIENLVMGEDAWLKQDRINKRLAKIENLVMEEDD